MKIVLYFREILQTLKSIDASLKSLAACVKRDHHGHGDRVSLSTKHWND
jgi:hypothetical protein